MSPDTPLRDVPWYIYVGYGLGVIAFSGYIFTRQLWMMLIGLPAILVTSALFRSIRQTSKNDQQHRYP